MSRLLKISLFASILFLIALPVVAQTKSEILSQAAQAYGLDVSSGGKGGFMGFSVWGIVWGLVFSAIGFIAFSYGKKNTEYVPMGIGIALLVYPYFVQNTMAIFVIGVVLSAALFFFRS